MNDTLRTDATDEQYLEAYSRLDGCEKMRLLHASLGLCTEAAEFADAIKKHVFYGKELDRVNLIEELGDSYFYMMLACKALGISLVEVAQTNLAKLKRRYPHKFTEELAINRNVEAERIVMEGNSI